MISKDVEPLVDLVRRFRASRDANPASAETKAFEDAIWALGTVVHGLGGLNAMHDVHDTVEDIDEELASVLEYQWSGIGLWSA